ncbi:MAG: caspase family protein [Thermodesulfobacteriota bacterium]|nr:caspase family protein [Thermodesulfobacteriota bacterium]
MRNFLILITLLLPTTLLAAQGSFNLRVLPQPPDLQVTVEFSEPSGNRILDAEETGHLTLTLSNNGKGDAFDVVAKLSTARNLTGLSYPRSVSLGTVAAGRSINKTIELTTTQSLPDSNIKIEIDLREANGFDPFPVSVAFSSKAFVPPKLILADLGIDDQNSNARVEPMEIVTLTARVQNVGQGEARQVSATVELGQNVFLAGDSKTRFVVGELAPGAYKDLVFSVYTNRRIANGDAIPIRLKIGEARSEFHHKAPLQLTMNAPARQAKQMVVQAQPSAPAAQIMTKTTSLRVDVDHNIPKGKKGGKYDIAVVIGNRDYTSVQGVDYAIRDAQIMREYLTTTLGFKSENIIYKENATLTDFNEIFSAQLPSWVDPKGKSRVFVYYTGHGAPDLNSGDAYFLPVNANPQYVSASGYAVQSLYANLAKLKVKDLTVVLDACFSGSSEKGMLFKGISPAMVKTKSLARGPQNSTVFTSAGKDQVSAWYEEKKHSLFTYYFLKGLQGGADVDKNAKLTVGEMETYLAENVTYKASRLKRITQQPKVDGDRTAVLVSYR